VTTPWTKTMKTTKTLALWTTATTAAAFVLLCACSMAQENSASAASPPSDTSLRELHSQVRELRELIEQMRNENAQSRAEMQELRQELQDTRMLLAPLAASVNANPSSGSSLPSQSAETATGSASPVSEEPTAPEASRSTSLGSRVQKLEESTQLLGSKIDEQYQTKVETASKYRARLSGIVLMNAFRNVGASDNLDLPTMRSRPCPVLPKRVLGPPCGNRRSGWRFLDRSWLAQKVQPMCNSIFSEDFPQPIMESTSASRACKPQVCGSTGRTLP